MTRSFGFPTRAGAAPARGAATAAVVAACAAAVVGLLGASAARGAYFDQAHRADALRLSDFKLKARFVVTAPVAVARLADAEAAAILAAPDAKGLFERDDGIAVHTAGCGEDDAKKARPCEREWESRNLPRSHGVATRKDDVLTLAAGGGRRLALRDWEKCAPHGECDGERFTYLGPLARSPYHAVEIAYGHDAPSLVLFDAHRGAIVSVHYGSEPTFVNAPETLLLSSEDMNDATSLLVTSLADGAPAIDLQCLGARTRERSFGVTFKRWASDAALDVVLTESRAGSEPAAEPRRIPVRFTRRAEGAWTLASPVDLHAAGFDCRARAGGVPAK